MPTINKLTRTDSVSAGDIAPIYVQNQGDARGASMSVMSEYFNSQFDSNVLADLANDTDPSKGAHLIGWDGGTSGDQMDLSKKLANYTALRNYSGSATIVRITNNRLSGFFYLDLVDTTSSDNGGTTIVDMLGRRWKREFTPKVLVEWFGAIGDGITNCTAAIASANTAGPAVHFSAGSYLAANLVMTKPWTMDDGAWIKYNGSASATDFIVKITGNDASGNLNLDGAGSAVSLGCWVTGARPTLTRIVVKSINSTLEPGGGVCAAVKLSGLDADIGEIVGQDLLIAGNLNASSPQLLALGGGSDRCIIGSLRGHNVTSGVVAAGTGSNSIGYIDLDGAIDNGIYNTAGKLAVGGIRYKGQDEPIVVIGGDLDLGSAIIESGFNAAFAFAACGDINIGEIILRGNGIESLFKTRDVGSVGNVRIGRIFGALTGNNLCTVDTGTVESFTVGEIDVIYTHTAGKNPTQWGYLTACKAFNVGRVNIKIIDATDLLTAADIFRFNFPVAPTKTSTLGEFNVNIVKADGLTFSDALFFGSGLAHQNVTINKGFMRTNAGPYLEKVTPDVPSDRLTANVLPTLGTWKRGQVLWRAFPTALGSPGWVCTTAGTPGTWGSLPALT